jgi:sn-glycerol 3-phosphate transport system substrate-binding protein
MKRLSALTLGVVLVAAACGGGGGGGGDNGGGGGEAAACPVDALDDVDPAEGKVEVVVWHSYVAETRDTLIALADEYNKSQDKVEVTIESQGESYEELLRKYTQGIPDENLPGIAILEDTVTQFIADSGTIVPGGSCFEAAGVSLDDYLPLAVDYYTVDGVFQGASANLSTIIMYYNREHFRQAGLDPDDPPGNLEELRATAEAIKAAGVTEKPLVMNMQPWFVEHWMTGEGAPIVNNENGRAEDGATEGAFDNETSTEILAWLQQMNADGLLNAVPGVEGQFEHYFAMALGSASITFETSTAATSINAFLEGTLDPSQFDLDLEELPAIDLDIGVAPYPGVTVTGQGQVGGGVWYIPNTNGDEVIAGAWEFINWINQPEQQVRWNLDGSYLPFNSKALDDPTLQENWETTRKGRWLAIAYDSLTNADPEFPGPLIGPYDTTREAVREQLDEVLLNGKDPADAAADANDAISEAVVAYNDENF